MIRTTSLIRTLSVVAVSCGLFASTTLAAAPSGAAELGPTTNGYLLLGGDGGVFPYGIPFTGSAASTPANCAPNITDRNDPDGTCFSAAVTPSGKGYWVLNGSTGVIYRFGDAGDFGQPATKFAGVRRTIVPTFAQIVPTPSGKGYWIYEDDLVSSLAKIDHFGDAGAFGDSTSFETAHPDIAITGNPEGMAATPDGQGYWEFHSDGGVFAFGSARFLGSMARRTLTQQIVAMAATADGKGYWLAAADGGVFAFGDAVFSGSMGGKPLHAPIVGFARNPAGPGYWLAAADGGVFAFGGAPFLGSAGGVHVAHPIFGIAAKPQSPPI